MNFSLVPISKHSTGEGPLNGFGSVDPDRDPRPRVCVFAPAPMLTITLEAHGGDPQISEIHVHAGGQGFWIARMVAQLGVDSVLCSSFGGETGAILRPLIRAAGVDIAEILTSGNNGAYVHDRRAGTRTEIGAMRAHTLDRHEVDNLYGATLTEALNSDITVLTGPGNEQVVPDDVYRRLASDVTNNGGRVIADLSGSRLAAALDGGLHLVKVSEEELHRDGELDGEQFLPQLVHDLSARGADHVVVSRAANGVVAVLDGKLVHLNAPRFVPFDTRGAGDSMTAAIAAELALGKGLLGAVITGTAAGAVNVTRRGLGTGVRRQIGRIAERVQVEYQPRPDAGSEEPVIPLGPRSGS